MSSFTRFIRRFDVLFSFIGIVLGSLVVYADKMPLWGLIVLVVLREGFGFLGMLAKRDQA